MLRLELILDLMAREVPPVVLAGVYTVVLKAQPCLAHYALAAAAIPLVTTNQDELVEDAGRRLGLSTDVLHVHGRVSKPGSIVTMLSQYVDGLPRQTARRLRARVAGSHLVVIGYSGRDLDVMPFLHNALRVTWLHFQPGGGPPPATEVRALKASLGRRMRIVEHSDPVQWLLERLPRTACTAVAAAGTLRPPGHSSVSLSDTAQMAFQKLPLVKRRLAVAPVLLHVNKADAACEGLKRALASHRRDPGIQLRLADALMLLQRRPEAVRHYARLPALTADPALRASALLGSAQARAYDADYGKALQELAEASTWGKAITDNRKQLELLARIAEREARIYAMTDKEDQAIRLYSQTARLAQSNGNLDLYITALVFGSDLHRSRGNYHQALANLEKVFDNNELYARPYTRVWARFYRGMALCAIGQLGRGLNDLEGCRTAARMSGNQQAVAWASLALASYYRESDLDKAEQAINSCEAAIQAQNGGMLLCELRLAWERAELARAQGENHEALLSIASLRQRLAHASPQLRAPYMAPHILAVEGEIARARGDGRAKSLLSQARALFAAGHWNHGVARMDVSLWLLSGLTAPPPALLMRCRKAGYDAEVRRLTNAASNYYPLHTL
jgi:tetratricopeptide (TPR) repeat protein